MDLYFRAWDVHELLAHHVAELAGLYQQAGVEVVLKDASGADWRELERNVPMTIGVGGAIQNRLMHGSNWAVVCVNTQHPLFWLVSQPSIERITELKGEPVGGRPLGQAPMTFMRIIFRQNGLDLLKDCSYLPQADMAGLRQLLRRGEAAAILENSPPFELERDGFQILAFFGDEFRTTTTGLAVNQGLVAADDQEVARMVAANRQALARLHEDRALAIRAIRTIEAETSDPDAQALYDRYIHPFWTRDGKPDREIAERSAAAIARELGVERLPAFEELYKLPQS